MVRVCVGDFMDDFKDGAYRAAIEEPCLHSCARCVGVGWGWEGG